MSKVVKCNSCNVIIDEMLSYIQNKLSVIDEDTLVRICTSAFTSEQIENSKALLFDSVPVDKAKIKRKNKGKEQRNLVDILNVFRTVEPDQFPIFVARDLDRLPPILFDHLDCTKLLKDILKVQNEIKQVKETYVTQTQLSEFKVDMLKYQNDSLAPASISRVNMSRGAWQMDSGPIGLSHIMDSPTYECNESPQNASLNLYRNIATVDGEETAKTVTIASAGGGGYAAAAAAGPSPTGLRPAAVTSPARPATPLPPPPPPAQSADRDNNRCITVGVTTERRGVAFSPTVNKLRRTTDEEGWQRVSHRKNKTNRSYRYIGTSGIARDNEGNFKAAVTKLPIFITKVHKDTTEKDITDYIYEKTQEKILVEKILFKSERDYNAYKFFVAENKLSMFLDSKLWPEGVIYRRFVNFKARIQNENGTFGDKHGS